MVPKFIQDGTATKKKKENFCRKKKDIILKLSGKYNYICPTTMEKNKFE